MTDRICNTFNSTLGGAKQTIGETIGNNNLAASGAQQKAQADAAQKAADAKTHAEGVGHKVQGEVQQNVGSLTGNSDMEARGHANEVRGDLERKMTDRLANSTNSYIGAAKQAIGNTIGNTTLAANGAHQQSQAESAQKAADAKTHAQGIGHKAEGQLQQTVGSLTGDTSVEARGNANEVRGDLECKV
ncbi:hypothetical protein BGX30_010107 [Mortierella sp. GBA39]|nr:hypothetical protein BGX30_010107 [Mortierella sp. GBA39]